MGKITFGRIAISVIAIGLSAQAQTLVLSDSFDTGGVATNDLNYNLSARQAGTAATNNLAASTNSLLLTSTGELNLVSGPAVVSTESLAPHIGENSFSIEGKGWQDTAPASEQWTILSVLSDSNTDWDTSPISILMWSHDYMAFNYGAATNTLGGGNDLSVFYTTDQLSSAIGSTYSAADPHTFEIRTIADSATTGTWAFYIDGFSVISGLPYEFGDANLRMSWTTQDTAVDTKWDDLEISTIPTTLQPEYLFFDNFNASDHVDANWLFGTRQTDGQTISSYSAHPTLHSITNNKLYQYYFGASLSTSADFGSQIEGKDFEFSCKVAQLETGHQQTHIYLHDETYTHPSLDTRMGMYIQGPVSGWACVLYKGTGAEQELDPVAPNEISPDYDPAEENTFQFISHPGTGGTNTYDVVINGVTVRTGLEYYFDGVERRIGLHGTPGTGTPPVSPLGTFYDDIYLKVIKGITYADWVEENSLTGADALNTADIEPDGMDNLLEYALGGDPKIDDAASILPTAKYTSDVLEYVYNRRVDADLRGLTYDVVINTNGLQLAWINTGNSLETDSGPIDREFDSVTNVLPITGVGAGFINLEITED